jgi:membrane peptidoglycan carboxypeptidase
MDLAQATAESVNVYYAQLMVRVGTPNAIDVARRMGITSPLRDYCSLVLGTENVTPLELASAYATLAAGGVHCRPSVLARVTGPTGRLPEQLRRSGTWDHGREMAEHIQFTIDSGVQVYFCDPRSPGSVVPTRHQRPAPLIPPWER